MLPGTSEVSDRDRRANLAALQESKRRIAAFDKEQKHADEQLEAARADADFAAASSGRLQSELDKIKRFAEHYTGTFPTGTPASKVIGVLADMLEESNRVYNATAAEAEKYRIAGESCENQYDSLRKKKSGH